MQPDVGLRKGVLNLKELSQNCVGYSSAMQTCTFKFNYIIINNNKTFALNNTCKNVGKMQIFLLKK